MAQAAALTGLSLSVLKWAKKSGCPAFRATRVYLDELREWLDAHRSDLDSDKSITKEQADIRLKLLRYDREKFKFEVEKKLYRSRAEIEADIKQIAQMQRALLQRKLESELPARLVGLGVIEITEAMRQTVDEVCRIFHDRTSDWIDNAERTA